MLLFLLAIFSFSHAALLDPFDLEAAGAYTADINVTVIFTYPFRTVVTNSLGQMTVSPALQGFAIATSGGPGSQWITPVTTYEYVPGYGCAFTDFNYSRCVKSYKQLSQVSNTSLRRVFGGLVRDPSACNTYGSSTIITDYLGRIRSYDIHTAISVNSTFFKVDSHVEVLGFVDLNTTILTPPSSLNCSVTTSPNYCDIFFAPASNNYVLPY